MRFLCIVVMVAAACVSRIATPGTSDLRASDPAVYLAVFDSIFVRDLAGSINLIVLRDRTDSTTGLKGEALATALIKQFSLIPDVDTAAIRDLAMRSGRSHSLRELSRLGSRIPVVLVDRQTLNSLPQEDPERYWDAFYKRYPGSSGVIEVNPIGYSESGDLAVAMIDQYCGYLCGNGFIVSLRRSAGAWRIVAIKRTWAS